MSLLRQNYVRFMEIKNYSAETIRIYVLALRELNEYYKRSLLKINPQEIQDFIYHQVKDKGLSWKTIHVKTCALKCFYHSYLRRSRRDYVIPTPKIPKRLPLVWSPEEIRRLIESAGEISLQSKAILQTAYATGMRLGELCHLRIENLDRNHRTIWVRQGKGAKDRAVPFTKSLITALETYWLAYRPKTWLFPARGDLNRPISEAAMTSRFKTIKKRAGLQRTGGIHSFRHSFATHLIARGKDIYTVQRLLGHKSPKTTLIYIHLAAGVIIARCQDIDLLDMKSFRSDEA